MDSKMFTGENYISSSKPNNIKNNSNYLCFSFVILLIIFSIYTHEIFYNVGYLWSYSGSYSFSYISSTISIIWVVYNIYLADKSDKLTVPESPWYLLIILSCITLALLLYVSQLLLVTQLLMLFLLWLLIHATFGPYVSKLCVNPFLLVISSLPVFILLGNYEQEIIRDFLIFCLNNLGILVDTVNNKLETLNIIIHINKTYTGLRYLNVIYIISFIYGFLLLNNTRLRFIYVLFSIFLSSIVIILRDLLLVLYAHYNGVTKLQAVLTLSGWLGFFVILSSVLFLGNVIKRFDSFRARADYGLYINNYMNDNSSIKLLFNFLIILIFFISFNTGLNIYNNFAHSLPSTNLLKHPNVNIDWETCSYCEYNNWHPSVGKPDANLMITYKKHNIKNYVDFYLAYYQHQYQGNSLTGLSSKLLFDGSWTETSLANKTITVKELKNSNELTRLEHSKVKVNRILLEGVKSKRIVWYWYWINGQVTINNVYAKILEIFDILSNFRTNSALISISAEYTSDHDLIAAEMALHDFVSENYSELYPKAKRIAVLL
jgi:EpsI family protein